MPRKPPVLWVPTCKKCGAVWAHDATSLRENAITNARHTARGTLCVDCKNPCNPRVIAYVPRETPARKARRKK